MYHNAICWAVFAVVAGIIVALFCWCCGKEE